MSLKYLACFLASLRIIAGVHAAPASSADLIPLERLHHIPQGWEQGRSVGSAEILRFRLAVKHQKDFEFEQHLLAISTPNHPKYGQHMKRDELKDMLRPSPAASTAIINWLKSEGVGTRQIEDDGDWINFYIAATEAERILDTKFYYYKNKARRHSKDSYPSVFGPPGFTSVHLDDPANHSFWPNSTSEVAYLPAFRDRSVCKYPSAISWSRPECVFLQHHNTPQCLRDLYHVDGFRGSDTNGK